jgi:hypothetical protein
MNCSKVAATCPPLYPRTVPPKGQNMHHESALEALHGVLDTIGIHVGERTLQSAEVILPV